MSEDRPSLRSVYSKPFARERVQLRAEQLVQDNRFTIAVVFPLVGAVMLVASAEGLLPAYLSFNPLLILFGTAVMRLPLLVGLAPLVSRRAAVLLGGAAAFAYGIEMVGIATGFPYGNFEYLVALGPMIKGVPLGLPIFFLPLVLNSYLLVTLLGGTAVTGRHVRLPATLAVVLAVDLVLDPAAVAIGFWAYDGGGAFYGVPVSNYLGWLLTGAITVTVVDLAFDGLALISRLESCSFLLDDLVSFVLLWGAINALYGNWLPVAVAGGFVAGLVRVGRFDVERPRFFTSRTSERPDAR